MVECLVGTFVPKEIVNRIATGEDVVGGCAHEQIARNVGQFSGGNGDGGFVGNSVVCLLYTSPSPRDA